MFFKKKPKTEPEEKKEQQQEAKEQEPKEVDTGFINEKIKSRPINRKKLARRTILTAALAVLFGAIACLVFLFLEPVISSWLNRSASEETSQEATSFPVDTTETDPEDLIQSEQQQTEEAVKSALSDLDTDALKEEIEQDIKADLESEADISADSALYKAAADAVSASMVTVTTSTSGSDWVGDAYVSSTKTSGVLVSVTDTNYLILTTGVSPSDAQSLQVTFSNDESAAASLLSYDTLTGIAILSVEKTDELSTALADVTAVTFGSSAKSLLYGEPVIALGSPTGTTGSVNYGYVTNAGLAIDVQDSNLYQITTSMSGSTDAAGILVNTDGEVVGVIDMDYNTDSASSLISAIGISELKPVLERMEEDGVLAGIGVHGTTVPDSVHTTDGVPLGAYITEVELKSPAMRAGLQSGDIIVSIGGTSVSTWDGFVSALNDLTTLDPVEVVVERQGADGYSTASLAVTPVNRLEKAAEPAEQSAESATEETTTD